MRTPFGLISYFGLLQHACATESSTPTTQQLHVNASAVNATDTLGIVINATATTPSTSGKTFTTTTTTYHTSNVPKMAPTIPPRSPPIVGHGGSTKQPVAPSKHSPTTTTGQTEDWKENSPQELEDLVALQIDNIRNDKYVPLVAATVGVIIFGFMMLVVQQLLEHPQGCVAKVCRITIAIVRIVLWPIKNLLFCGLCCSRGRRGVPQPDHEKLCDENLDDLNLI